MFPATRKLPKGNFVAEDKVILYPTVKKDSLDVLQVNMGLVCNQNCTHCHHQAGPKRNELMTKNTVKKVIEFLKNNKIRVVDITGGAPELNPNFKFLVKSTRNLVDEIIIRSNLTVFYEPGLEDIPEFLKENEAHLICSLPCYLKENVDGQRGCGAYDKSIKALKMLNGLGYGGGKLKLDLVYNPTGPALPGCQKELETAYKENLLKMHNIVFDNLITITNMPLGRFKDFLMRTGGLERYTRLLKENRDENLFDSVMCRRLISVDWDGRLYDCDFNLALHLPIRVHERESSISDTSIDELSKKEISIGEHCFGCIAGLGSSCFGTLK